MCRVTGLEEQQQVSITLVVDTNELELSEVWQIEYSDPLDNEEVVSTQFDIDEDIHALYLVAAVYPESSFDACDNDYTLQCKLKTNGRWQTLIPPPPPSGMK
jgi:hypothetical protein